MLVLAAPGLLVPQEEKPRNYLTDTPPEGAAGYTVPESAYYLRRVAEGDLVVIDPNATKANAITPTTGTRKGAE